MNREISAIEAVSPEKRKMRGGGNGKTLLRRMRLNWQIYVMAIP